MFSLYVWASRTHSDMWATDFSQSSRSKSISTPPTKDKALHERDEFSPVVSAEPLDGAGEVVDDRALHGDSLNTQPMSRLSSLPLVI